MAENLDYSFSSLVVGNPGKSYYETRGNYYNNDRATYGVNGNKYGLLYNYAAVKYLNDNRHTLIPGLHVPTLDEWITLATAVGGTSVAGTRLKSTSGWDSGDGDGTTNFNAYPAGFYYGEYINIGKNARFWTADAYNSTKSYSAYFNKNESMFSEYADSFNQFSVRLVMD